MKATVLYPARDVLTLEPLWRFLISDGAWNVSDGEVADSSFFTDRGFLTPQEAAWGPAPESAPIQPFRIVRIKAAGASPGFFGSDAEGRDYLVKLDHPDYPELGSSASIISSRIYHALGYNVPAVYPVTLHGTGDARFEGRRAVASLLVPNVVGHFQFDWFRYRREVRGMRLVAAWLNDTDRAACNTLVSVKDGIAQYHLIDFNSTLGAWQGRPKEPWRGWRYACEGPISAVDLLTLGLLGRGYDPEQAVISPAVGRFTAQFDPMTWKPQVPNTAFDRMSADDRRWIVQRIAGLTRAHLEAIVEAAGLSNPQDRVSLVETLLARQARILALADDKNR